jgi:hypothetical protein
LVAGAKAAADTRWEDPIYRANQVAAQTARQAVPEECSNWRGDEVGYAGRHQRLRKAFGSATRYFCVENCCRPASDWSLNADVPSECLRADASGHAQGLNFSPYDAHYYPRCRACHLKLDRRL